MLAALCWAAPLSGRSRPADRQLAHYDLIFPHSSQKPHSGGAPEIPSRGADEMKGDRQTREGAKRVGSVGVFIRLVSV